MDLPGVLRTLRAIGADRFVSPTELPHGLADRRDELAWQIYTDEFDAFTGGSLDPLFRRLDHPATAVGSLHLEDDEAVLIVGTGPSLAAALPELSRVRPRFRVITSPRGAEALQAHGIVPDLVLIVHRSALDAEISLRQFRRLDVRPAFEQAHWTAAETKTPAGLLQGIARERVFIPENLLSWGVWPADAVAMALEGGATRVGLLGVDLGSPGGLDPASQPTAALLSLLTHVGGASFADCGELGAPKPGWQRASLMSFASAAALGPLTVSCRRRPALASRVQQEIATLHALEPLLRQAREALDDGLDARSCPERGRRPQDPRLTCACQRMLSWKDDVPVRRLLQEGLGVSFLPRLWRTGVTAADRASLWRPVVLATHELIGQAARLQARIDELVGARQTEMEKCDAA